MANSTKHAGRFISITLDGGTDWNCPADVPQLVEGNNQGLMVKRLVICLGENDAVCLIRNSKVSAQTAPIIAYAKAAAAGGDTNQHHYDFGEGTLMWPAVDASDVSGASQVLIELVV